MQFPAVPREFLFVAASCRWPVAQADELRRLCSMPLDWPLAVRIAKRHRVVGLVHNAAHAVNLALPEGVKQQLADRALAIARNNMAAARENLRLQQRFGDAGIPVVLLKGVALAQKLYGSVGLRHARDIDLLVRPEHASEALRLLEADGYALVAPERQLDERQRRAFIGRGHEMELVRRNDGQRVELHWRLAENPFLLRNVDAFSRTEEIAIAGGTLRTLDGRSLFAYLCVHGAGHFWFRLKWLADIQALLAGRHASEIGDYYRYAESVGAALCAGQALLMCRDVFGLSLPPMLQEKLIDDRRLTWLVRLARRNLIGRDPAAEPTRNIGYSLQELFGPFLLGRGFNYMRAQCAITLIAPADVIRWTMPSWLAFMYGVLRLPFWIWRRAMPPKPIK